jgi:hypothetical protein
VRDGDLACVVIVSLGAIFEVQLALGTLVRDLLLLLETLLSALGSHLELEVELLEVALAQGLLQNSLLSADLLDAGDVVAQLLKLLFILLATVLCGLGVLSRETLLEALSKACRLMSLVLAPVRGGLESLFRDGHPFFSDASLLEDLVPLVLSAHQSLGDGLVGKLLLPGVSLLKTLLDACWGRSAAWGRDGEGDGVLFADEFLELHSEMLWVRL